MDNLAASGNSDLNPNELRPQFLHHGQLGIHGFLHREGRDYSNHSNGWKYKIDDFETRLQITAFYIELVVKCGL